MKQLVWLCMFIGGAVGSYIPALWGAGFLSFSSVIFGAIGGFVGIWVGYKISQ